MIFELIAGLVMVGLCSGQGFQYQPIPYMMQNQGSVQHPAVVANSIAESQLPPEYRNEQYKNPQIAAALAKESWFTDKESPVVDRAAEKIARNEIFKIFKNAGWAHRRRRATNMFLN